MEVDITSSSSKRLDIYAALGVAEVWRFKSGLFAFLALVDGEYVPIDVSRIIIGLPASEVANRVRSGIAAKGETRAIRTEWQRWLRDNRHLHDIG